MHAVNPYLRNCKYLDGMLQEMVFDQDSIFCVNENADDSVRAHGKSLAVLREKTIGMQ